MREKVWSHHCVWCMEEDEQSNEFEAHGFGLLDAREVGKEEEQHKKQFVLLHREWRKESMRVERQKRLVVDTKLFGTQLFGTPMRSDRKESVSG